MYLEQRYSKFAPPQFNLATNTILGTTQRWSIDRTWPIEEILVCVNYDVTTGFTTATTPSTTDQVDNAPQLLQKINLTVNDGRQPRTVVDCRGIALLEYISQVGYNLDEATLRMLAASQNIAGALGFPVGRYQTIYRIPCVDPLISEPLRTRSYLPVHTYPQDPVLTLTFNTINGMCGNSTGVIGTIRVDILLIRRVPTPQSEKFLRDSAGSNPTGYIDWDLIETPFALPLGTSSEVRLPIPVPGNYMNLLFMQYKGGASMTRLQPLDVDVGDTIANNLGLETKWRLETGLVVNREWNWKLLRTINDYSRPVCVLGPVDTVAQTVPTPIQEGFVGVASAGAVTSRLTNQMFNFPYGPQGATSAFRAGTSTFLDFLGDGFGDGGNELGSLLDTNTPANNGLKMELIGIPANVATNQSVIFVMGRRLFGDISRWQKW